MLIIHSSTVMPVLFILRPIFTLAKASRPIPVAVRSKAWVYGSSLTRIVGSNPARVWMSVSCECCVLSGRGLCDGLVTRPEESYRMWCVYSVIVKPRKMRRPRPPRGCRAIGERERKRPDCCYMTVTNVDI
jgi:hypothetical protein